MSDASVLVLGGVGFIGRNLVVYLVENGLAGTIRVADKALPQTSYLTPRQKAAFEKVEFVQANLSREQMVKKAFKKEDGQPFDYVFNCAGITKYGQGEAVYKENVVDVSLMCAKEAAETKVKRFVEVSTAQVYSADKKPSSEDGKVSPWTDIAKAKLKVEQELKNVPDLSYVIARPAIVYGASDMLGLTPRLIIGAVYKKLDQPMKLLWTGKLRINTVHVDDCVRGLWTLATKGEQGEIYNIADKADSSQDSINNLLDALYGIKHEYFGTIISNLAKLKMKDATEDANEQHMEPWAEMCQAAEIVNTPLSPYLDQELLYNNSLSVDGSKIESLGFSYEQPEPTLENIRPIVEQYIEMKLFPAGYLA